MLWTSMPLLPDVANGFLHVDGVPVYDDIEGEAQGAKLLFLALLKRTSDLPAFAMVDAPAEAMAQFRVVKLSQNAPSEGRIVNVVKSVDCLGDPADFGKRTSQTGGFIPDLECSRDSRRLEMPEFQRAGQVDHVGPVFPDQREIDGVFAEAVERAVIGLPVNPPQPGITEVSQPRAELVAKQPEQTKYCIRIGGGVGHEFHRLQLGFMLEEKGKQHKAVAQGCGSHDAVQAAELVGQQIVPSLPSRLTEIL